MRNKPQIDKDIVRENGVKVTTVNKDRDKKIYDIGYLYEGKIYRFQGFEWAIPAVINDHYPLIGFINDGGAKYNSTFKGIVKEKGRYHMEKNNS